MTKKERCWYIIDNVLIQSEADDISSYLDELEHQVTELKESQKQKQIIRLCNRLDEAEQQKAELIQLLKEIDENVLTEWPYEYSYYRNRVSEIINK